MSRPQITVTVSPAIARRGLPTETGTAFVVYAGATGPTAPTRCRNGSDATAANVPDAVALHVADALRFGAPEVIVLRATAVDAAAVTEAEWKTALAKLTSEFGSGQVLIPGVTTAAAYAALLDHADETGRCVLLDAAANAGATALVATATGLRAALGATSAGMFAGWPTVPAAGGTTRNVPPSVAVAGLVARGDAINGHANHAPAGDQGREAGVVTIGTTVSTVYTDAEVDALYDAGVNVFRMVLDRPTLVGWRALTTDANFRQLNWGRMTMQLRTGIAALGYPFHFKQIDGKGRLFSALEGALRGYLTDLWARDALYGLDADDAFDVDVAGVNTPQTAAAGELHSASQVSFSPHTENVLLNITTSIAEGV